MSETKKKRTIPHTYVIIFGFIIFSAVLTWFVPGGKYEKITDPVTQTTQMVFTATESQPQTWQVFTALVDGFARQSKIIVFILIIGGAFWIVNSSKAIDAGIFSFLSFTKKLEHNALLKRVGVNNVVITLIMLMFSIFGAVFGMSEETIAFVVILVPLAISMGYDSIVGVCMVYVAAHIGFAGAVLNPFTIGIAQGLVDLPLFSGLEYRLFCWLVLNVITIGFVLKYAAKIKKNPQASPMYQADGHWREHIKNDAEGGLKYNTPKSAWYVYFAVLAVSSVFACFYPTTVLTIGQHKFSPMYILPVFTAVFALVGVFALRKSVHFFVLLLLGYTILYLVVGVIGYGWYITEIAGLFLALGVAAGVAVNYSANEIVKQFMDGTKDILSAALVVGLAGGIIVILENGVIIDTLLHGMAQVMDETGRIASLGVMYAIQTMINIVIPSGSAKAALTMPIMAPFADLIGVSRQATVMAFQFGDGFTNMITPTSGVLIAVLGIARIPYSTWFKWLIKFMILLIIVGFLLLIPTVTMNLNGF